MEELFPSESPLAAIFDETGQMTTTARTFVSAIEDGKHGLLISFTDPTLVQVRQVLCMQAPDTRLACARDVTRRNHSRDRCLRDKAG